MDYAYNFDKIIEIDGGLKYFHEVLPQSIGFEKKGFDLVAGVKSNAIKLSKSKGIWYYKDFKSGETAINAVNYICKEQNVEFIDALKHLYSLYNLSCDTVALNKPILKFSATDEPIGFFKVEFADSIMGLKNIAPFASEAIANEYNFKSILSYSTVTLKKNTTSRLQKTIIATEKYPIYGYEQEGFVKIYEPKANMNKNKDGERVDPYAMKHHILGTKPTRHIYGLERLISEVDLPALKRIKYELKQNPSKSLKESLLSQLSELQLDSVIICSGGSDGLNVASLGYDVIWMNSETEQIYSDEYYLLQTICKNVYNIPDLDTTGVEMAVKLGLNFLEIKSIWLPEHLKETNQKDIADWVRARSSFNFETVVAEFSKLKKNALEFKFWSWLDSSRGGAYSLDNVCMNYFLKHNGFYKYVEDPENTDEEIKFIHQKKNVITKVQPSDVKDFVSKWLIENAIDRKIQNMVLRSSYFSKKALLDLPKKEINTKSGTRTSQMYYYKNKSIIITKDSIAEKPYLPTDNMVWDTSILKRQIKLQSPHFSISKDISGNWDIEIMKKDCTYFNILINTSRMFWQKELEDNFKGKDAKTKEAYHNANRFNIAGSGLSEEEIAIQKLQLINKIFCIGYLLHQYKDAAKTYYVFAMDAKKGDKIADANGGSAKSLTISTLEKIVPNWHTIDGRQDQNKATFLMSGVTKNTPIIFTDDASQFWNHNPVFNQITGQTEANQKGGKIFKLSFTESPKQVCASNYVPNDLNKSFLRRLLLCQYSDYYHSDGKEYESSRSVKDDFNGATLWDETYGLEDWNNDDNFWMQCVQFYLSQADKIDPPKENLVVRNLMQKIGDVQLKWCNDFFTEENLNVYIHTDDVQDDYKRAAGKTAKATAKMTEGIEEWCEYMSYLSKKSYVLEGKKKAITNTVTGKRNSIYHFFINTTGTPVTKDTDLFEQTVATPLQQERQLDPNKKIDDLPF